MAAEDRVNNNRPPEGASSDQVERPHSRSPNHSTSRERIVPGHQDSQAILERYDRSMYQPRALHLF
ncbi:MAG: hypothetical protein LC775_00160 [Acidobacteria bacterium]|nr:hypothetical protein [Acidobacteriota bacterium]